MRRLVALLAVVASVLVTASMRAAPEPEPLPTPEELHKTFDDGQYQQVLQKLLRVMQLKGNAAKPYDQADLWSLRGETFLQLKQQAEALKSFEQALKEATNTPVAPAVAGGPAAAPPGRFGGGAAAQPAAAVNVPPSPHDPKQIAKIRATILLIKQSRNFAYTPKSNVTPGSPAAPISILDLSQRKAAFTALLSDQQAELEPKAKAANRGNTMAPIIDVVRGLGDMRAVEMTATDATKVSDSILVEMGDRASKMMGDEVDRDAKKVAAIDATAHTTVMVQAPAESGSLVGARRQLPENRWRYRGLEYQDQQYLKGAIDVTEKIALASKDFATVAPGPLAATFDQIEKNAEKAYLEAKSTLNDNYNLTLNTPNPTRK